MIVFDTQLFILKVEKEECLWKINSKQYCTVDRYAKAKAWINIASSMFDDWESFNKKEQELKVEELKKKWKHCRDNYTRVVNKTRKIASGSEAKNFAKKYAYFDALSFLQPVIKKRKTTRNYGVSMCSIDTSIIDHESFEEECSSQKDDTAGRKENATQEKNNEKTSYQSNLLNLMKSLPTLQKTEDNDPDKQFLLSFLPEFKKMDEYQKLDFKIEFSQFVKRILNPDQLPLVGPRPFHQNYYMPIFQNPFYHQHSLPNFQTGLPQTAQIYNSSLLPTYQSPSTHH